MQGAHGSCACWQTCSQPVVSSCLSPSLTIAAAHAGIGWEHTLTRSCLHPESVWHWLGQPVLIASGPGCVDVVLSVRLTWREPAALIPNGLAESHQRSASLEKVWAKARGSDVRCLPLLSPCTCVLSSQLITDKSFSLPSFAFFFFYAVWFFCLATNSSRNNSAVVVQDQERMAAQGAGLGVPGGSDTSQCHPEKHLRSPAFSIFN